MKHGLPLNLIAQTSFVFEEGRGPIAPLDLGDAKGKAAGIRFDNQSLWSRIERTVDASIASTCAGCDNSKRPHLLSLTKIDRMPVS